VVRCWHDAVSGAVDHDPHALSEEQQAQCRHGDEEESDHLARASGLRSSVEDRWREATRSAGKGADLEAMRVVDPELVEKESQMLGLALRQVINDLPDGGRALVVGHSPTHEAAVLGLAGVLIPPLGKGHGVLLTEHQGKLTVEPLD
jgi:hypothetical protein